MRELITGQSIAQARKAGQSEIFVSQGAIITPQARDDAKQFGISICYGTQANTTQVAQATQNAVTAQATHRNAMNTNNANNGVAPAWSAPVVSFGNGASTPPAAMTSQPADIAGQVAEQVVARLQSLLGTNAAANPSPAPQSTQAQPVAKQCAPLTMEQTVAQVVSEMMQGAASTGSTCNSGASGAFSPLPAASAAPVGVSMAAGSLSGVDVVPFPVNAPTTSIQGEMNIEEALLPGESGPGVTRFCFANTSLDWTFANDEVLVVTKGTVQITQNGSAVSLVAGGAARMRKGTSVILTAQGDVCFVTSSFTK